MALRHKLLNLKTCRILYKQPEYTCEFINIMHDLLFCFLSRYPHKIVFKEKKSLKKSQYVSVSSQSIILVATTATPIVMMSAATSAVMVTVATPVFLLMIAVPAVAVVLMTARTQFFCVALISAAAVHLGRRMLIGGVTVLP